MSLAFEIAASGSRRVRRLGVALRAVGWAGVALTAGQGIAAGDTAVWGSAIVLALALEIAVAGASYRCGRRATLGNGARAAGAVGAGRGMREPFLADGSGPLALRVGADGHCALRVARSASTPFDPLRWFVVAGIAWISGRADGRSVNLLVGADRASPDEWARLLRWLRWLDRGGPGAA